MVNLTIPNITVSETTPTIPTNQQRYQKRKGKRKQQLMQKVNSHITSTEERNADIVMAKRRAHTREEVLQDGLHGTRRRRQTRDAGT